MNDSMFDPQTLLDNVEITGAMSTKVAPTPLGRYTFQVRKYTAKRIVPNDSNKQPFTVLEVDCVASGDQLTPAGQPIKSITGKDENFARYSCYLDFVEGTNSLDMGEGRNVGLGKLRAAVGQNDPTQPWAFRMLIGQVFSAEVEHRQDKNDKDRVFAELKNPLPVGS